jgi:hypothetical protein
MRTVVVSEGQGAPGPALAGRRPDSGRPSATSLTGRQKRRILLSLKESHRLHEVQEPHLAIPTELRRPAYWRDFSVEVGGTLVSAALLFGFGRMFGYIERPDGREEVLHLLGVILVVSSLAFVVTRVRRVRAEHAEGSVIQRVAAYVRAAQPHWSVPLLLMGSALSLGYF